MCYDSDEGIFKVSHQMKIRRSVALDGFPYKYCVLTPYTAAYEDREYECIYTTYSDISADYANRYLKLTASQRSKLCYYVIVIY